MIEPLPFASRVVALYNNRIYGTKGETPDDPAMTVEQATKFIQDLVAIKGMSPNAFLQIIFRAQYVGSTKPKSE